MDTVTHAQKRAGLLGEDDLLVENVVSGDVAGSASSLTQSPTHHHQLENCPRFIHEM